MIRSFLLSVALLLAAVSSSQASLLVFGQGQSGTPASWTTNGAGGLSGSGTNILVDLTSTDLGFAVPVTGAYLNYSYAGSHFGSLGALHSYDLSGGTFTITSGVNGTGTNYLSGSFSGTQTFTTTGGTANTLADSTVTGQILSFNSDFASSINPPLQLSWSYTGVSPNITPTANTTHVGAISGLFEGSPVPEATSAAIWAGLSLLGLSARRRLS